MYPVRYGAPGVPVNLEYGDRYDPLLDGGAVEVSPNEMPPVARPRLVHGDILTTSYNAKDPYSEEELRRMHIDGWNVAMNEALTGRRNNADQTRLQGVRLAAAGYVNPHDVVAGAHRPDVPLFTTDVEPMP